MAIVNGSLDIAYGCATKVDDVLDIVYWCAPLVAGNLEIAYGCAMPVAGELDICYRLPGVVEGELEIVYAISGGKVDGVLDICYRLPEHTPVDACLDITYGCADFPGWHEDHAETGLVWVDGVQIGVSSISIKNDLAWLEATIEVGTADDYALCVPGAELTIAALGEVFVLYVEESNRSDYHGGSDFAVSALSIAAWLDAPYADTIDGELTGMASVLATGLAANVTVAWQTVDWFIGPNIWFAGGDTPLELINQLADAVGAEVQSLPDGTLLVQAGYPESINNLDTVIPAAILIDQLTWESLGEQFDHRPGYNRYSVTDNLSVSDSLRPIEMQDIDDRRKYARGYQVPWKGNFELTHSGGGWVSIEPLGIENRQVTETIEVKAGGADVSRPVYGLVSWSWLQIDLGDLEYTEDGRLTAAIAGQSLVAVTYTTKSKKWLVTDSKPEQLLLTMDEVA